MRDILYPFTAMKYKESTKLRLKEVLFGAKAFGVKNLFLMSSKDKGDYIKFGQLTNGPTFTFKIEDFSLTSDLISGGISTQVEDTSKMGIPLIFTQGFSGHSKSINKDSL